MQCHGPLLGLHGVKHDSVYRGVSRDRCSSACGSPAVRHEHCRKVCQTPSPCVCGVPMSMLQFRAQAADKGIPFVDLKNLSLQELQLYLLPVFRCAAHVVDVTAVGYSWHGHALDDVAVGNDHRPCQVPANTVTRCGGCLECLASKHQSRCPKK